MLSATHQRCQTEERTEEYPPWGYIGRVLLWSYEEHWNNRRVTGLSTGTFDNVNVYRSNN
jgi:hypothetical protein